MTIRDASSQADWALVRALLQEYADWLGIDLSSQNFDYELLRRSLTDVGSS